MRNTYKISKLKSSRVLSLIWEILGKSSVLVLYFYKCIYGDVTYATHVPETSCNKVKSHLYSLELTLSQCELTSLQMFNYDKNVFFFFLHSNLGAELRSHDLKSFIFS